MRDLAVLIPTRGRPENIRKVISAWDFTNAWDRADMVLIIDQDDPAYQGYLDVVEEEIRNPDTGEKLIKTMAMAEWMPMVHKLNLAATALAPGWFALGFAGDDHLPQTMGWAERYLTVLREVGTGMVYGDDGYQGEKLSTEWAVTADAVRALGRMVPADVEHMYCDNAMMDLFGGAGALRFLPEIRIEHMHPIAGKAQTDEQYQRVNHRDQFTKDRNRYQSWKNGQMSADVAAIRDLRKGRPDVTTEPIPVRPRVAGSAPRRVERSGPTANRRQPRLARVPRHFRNVRAATPEDVMLALADFAAQVPADQEIVELGVFQGRTALQMAWGAGFGQGAHVTGIDPWDLPGNVYDPPFTDAESRTWAHHWISTLGYADKIRLVQGFSHEVAESWPKAEDTHDSVKRVGLLYVDGDHTKEGARRDIVAWAPHLAEGARIAVDDYGHPDWPGVGQAVDELVDEGFLEPIELFHDRLAVTRLAPGRPGTLGHLAQVYGEDGTLADIAKDFEGLTLGEMHAITSEGVSPSPYPAAGDQVAVTVDLGTAPVTVGPAAMNSAGGVDLLPGAPFETTVEPDEVDRLFGPDTEMSTHPSVHRYREVVNAGELEDISAGTPIGELNLVHLKALAKHRGIVLGARKDKRAEILQALADGR